jgi:hypothetical protein
MNDAPSLRTRGAAVALAALLVLGCGGAPSTPGATGATGAAGGDAEAIEGLRREIADLRADVDVLAGNVGSLEKSIRDLAEEIRWGRKGAGGEDGSGGGPFGGNTEPGAPGDPRGETFGDAPPPAQPFVAYTEEQKAALRTAAAAKGIVLGDDRVSVPGEVILREGALEFFAVFPGGKTHESILLLCGKRDAEGNPSPGLGATLNASLMALGLRPGTPLRVLPGGGTRPPRGTTVHIAVEWDEDGKRVRARAEDLLWDVENGRALESGKFLYTGSFFEPDGYIPDLSGDAVAVYSTVYTLIDLADPRAVDDSKFAPCTPRIPGPGTKVDVVFSPAPLVPTRTWDPTDPKKRTDEAPGGGVGPK